MPAPAERGDQSAAPSAGMPAPDGVGMPSAPPLIRLRIGGGVQNEAAAAARGEDPNWTYKADLESRQGKEAAEVRHPQHCPTAGAASVARVARPSPSGRNNLTRHLCVCPSQEHLKAFPQPASINGAHTRAKVEDENYMEQEAASIKVGDRCQVAGGRRGDVAFVGRVPELPLGFWVGVKYDEPVGKNDGSVKGVRYFECPDKYGGFVRPDLCEVGDFTHEQQDRAAHGLGTAYDPAIHGGPGPPGDAPLGHGPGPCGPLEHGPGARPSRARAAGERCEALALVRHAISQSGNALARYYHRRSLQTLRSEQWRVFTSSRPITTMYKLQWVRLLSLLVGLWGLLRPPEGIAIGLWTRLVPESSLRRAHMLRFTVSSLRSGETALDELALPGFGLLRHGCRISGTEPGAVLRGANSSTVHYSSEVEFDGWYLATGAGDPARDPSRWELRSSLDGETWELVAASWQQSMCETGAQLETGADADAAGPPALVIPTERRAEVLVDLTSMSCLWNKYVEIVAFVCNGAAPTLAALAAIFVSTEGWSSMPVLLLGAGSLMSGLLKLIAAGACISSGLSVMPPYSPAMLAMEGVLEMLVFPGPLFFSELMALEQACVWGALQFIALLAGGELSVVGPVMFVVGGSVLYFREARSQRVVKAVSADVMAFSRVWERIRQEEGSERVIAWLGSFERDITARLGLSRQSDGGQSVLASSLRAAPSSPVAIRPVADRDMSGSFVTSDAGGGRAETDAGAGYYSLDLARGRRLTLIEERSPMLQATISKVLQSHSSRINSLEQLYAQATVVDPIFRLETQRLARTCNAHVYVEAETPGAAPELRPWIDVEARGQQHRVIWTPIKTLDRAVHKASAFYQGDVSNLHDLVRQRLVLDSLQDLRTCLVAIAETPHLRIVSMKNRFDARAAVQRTVGYRDVTLVLRVVTELTDAMGVSGHGCELQLALRDLAALISPAQHTRYLAYKDVMHFKRTWPKYSMCVCSMCVMYVVCVYVVCV